MEDLCTNACGGASQREWRAMVIAASLVGTAVVARALRALDPAQSDPLIEAAHEALEALSEAPARRSKSKSSWSAALWAAAT